MGFKLNPLTGQFDLINTLPTLTAGSVVFSNGTTLAEDNANFFWDNINHALSIGETSLFGFPARVRVGFDIIDPTLDLYVGTLNDLSQHLTVDGDPNIFGSYNLVRSKVASGATANGALFGSASIVDRSDPADLGANSSFVGGFYSQLIQGNGAKSTSTYAGFISGFHSVDNAGTIGNMYDFWGPPSIGLPAGVVTNRYGIFIEPEANYTKKNWLSGNLLVGGTVYAAPTTTLGVQGNIYSSLALTDSGANGVEIHISSHSTADGSNTTTGFQSVASGTIDATFTNDKAVSGLVNTVTRGDGTDDGTLSAMTGTTSLLFHNSGAAGHTTETYGSSVVHFLQQGTQDTIYDYFSQTVPAGTGVATTHYGLYLGSDPTVTKQNWMAGDTRLGGSSFSAPAEALDVNGNVLAGIFKGTQLGINNTAPQAAIHVGAATSGSVHPSAVILGTILATGDAGQLSTVCGASGQAAGIAAFVAGNFGTATGIASAVFGDHCIATGDNAFCTGSSSLADGGNSFASGFENESSGANSLAHGKLTIASGDQSVCHGESSLSSGTNSFAAGYQTAARGFASFGLGKLANASQDGCGVLTDNQAFTTSSDTTNQFKARFSNGFVFCAGGGSNDVDGDLLSIKGSHVTSNQTTAPTASPNAGAGTGATCTVSNATDIAGRINLTTTAVAPAAGSQATITFDTAYTVAPIVTLTAANSVAAARLVSSGAYVTSTTTGFDINFTAADVTGGVYVYNYHVIETQ